MNLNSREKTLTLELVDALASSLELPETLSRVLTMMPRLIPADHVAICMSRPGQPGGYEWMVTGAPTTLFAHYQELAPEDFVRDAVVRRRNVALRDSEMLPRRELKRSPLYLRCRELGLPLEHVMAVLLDVNLDWHCGLTLYRERPQPFSDRNRALLQHLVPLVTRRIRDCRMFGELTARDQILDALFLQDAAVIVLAPPSREMMRTARATSLLEKWFPSSERGPSNLPKTLEERLAWVVTREEEAGFGPDMWVHPGEKQNLRATFVRLPPQGGKSPWALVLQEFSHAIPLPADMRRQISTRQAEIVECVLSNWDNEFIAAELGLTPNTVKTHLRNIFPKLGVENRTDLMYQAAWYRKPL